MVPRAITNMSASRSFMAHPASLADVRTFIREMGERGDVPLDATTDLLLAVSEAGTNSVIHSGSGTLEVEWEQRDGRVSVGVRDEGVFRSGGERPDRTSSAGLGFQLMHATMDRVMVEPGTNDRPGTVVWLEKSLEDEKVLESA